MIFGLKGTNGALIKLYCVYRLSWKSLPSRMRSHAGALERKRGTLGESCQCEYRLFASAFALQRAKGMAGAAALFWCSAHRAQSGTRLKCLMGNPVNEDQSMARLGLCAFWDNPGGDYVTYMCQIRVNSAALCISITRMPVCDLFWHAYVTRQRGRHL